ncbi:hypothetical protein [Sphingomonas sp. 1P08PE]|uniref:hypothetical protein n=1 Tax=Sphingomonas sp. 1P08PE TaxID=554122 RepID=UPI00399F4560
MDDREAVARDMEGIFGSAATPPAPRAAGTGLFADRRGQAAAWLAAAVAALGLAIVVTERPRPPASVPVAPLATVTAIPVTPSAPVVPARIVRSEPPAPIRRVRPTPVRRPMPAATIRPRPARTAAPPRPARLEAPHLTGEALRRALAADVIVTRRLNQQALERDAKSAD